MLEEKQAGNMSATSDQNVLKLSLTLDVIIDLKMNWWNKHAIG